MTKHRETYYRYRAFSTTLDSLCQDTLHFAHPGTFNDPLDCDPTIECDSDLDQLRALLDVLIRRRVSAEVLESLRRARLGGDRAAAHANKRAQTEATSELANIGDHATNPEYEVEKDEAESWLLVQEIQRELRQHYARGVCCFSRTYRSPVLWSHYGDNHEGLCIGYGTDRVPKPTLKKVIYGGNRGIKTSTLARTFVHDDDDAKADLDRDVLLRKARGWSYEREWRLIGDQGLQDSPLLLKEVIFGLRCGPSIKHAVVRALDGRDQPVQFYEMYEVRSRYVLRRKPLELDDFTWLPKTAESGEEIFGPSDADEQTRAEAADAD